MTHELTRRTVLKLAAASAAAGLNSAAEADAAAPKQEAAGGETTTDPWGRTYDRVWLGGDYWANPMEDWRVVKGAAECQHLGGGRNVHSLTHKITKPHDGFVMSVKTSLVEMNGQDGGAGFRVGVRSDLDEHRSNCFAGGGLDAGIVGNQLVLGPETKALDQKRPSEGVELRLTGTANGQRIKLVLEALTLKGGEPLGRLDYETGPERVIGNVALVNNYSNDRGNQPRGMKPGRSRYRFQNWTLSGQAFKVSPEHRFGPILWSMYTLSDSRGDEGWVLKLNALTGPLGEKDNQKVELFVERDGQWQSLGEKPLDTDAWVAAFRLTKWDEQRSTPYKLVYREQHTDGEVTAHEWTGIIRANPAGRPLRLAALTCQNDYAFPYAPVAENVVRVDPDLVFFAGDQLYENHGGFGIIRSPAEPAILNYLRKFYQFGWAFREAMKDRPTVCLPDDHDVFQGNIWGEGGAEMDARGGASSQGGYIQPARMVNVVHKTNTGHHPDPFDPTPCLQDISVYYGDLVYGDVSFAIIADRQWKSGPENVETGSGRADHVPNKEFDTSVLDKPGLELLGERQEKFLKQWAEDWRGHSMKVLLSQTVFAGVATHHGGYDGYLKADLDSGSWPQAARNRAIEILRPSMALHVNGDQHLTTMCQYGTSEQRNGNWSFCTPAIAAGYPRWWRPDDVGMPHENRPKHGLPNTGEFRDGFNNCVYVYAVGNPEVGRARDRYERAHEKGSGFGLVTIDTAAKTYLIESFRFLIDVTDGKPSNQFPGWPVTIHQAENQGENRLS